LNNSETLLVTCKDVMTVLVTRIDHLPP